jgi:ATP-dependent helicase/nuclease subunit A
LLGEHADWAVHEAAEQPFLDAEQNRLLYVAATRARRMLVVSRWTGKARQPAWDVLNNYLAEATELAVPAAVAAAPVEALDCCAALQDSAAAARALANGAVREESWSIASVTAEAHHITRMTRAVDAAADDPTKVVTTDTPAHRADAGMAWGTLIHGLLEHAMRHKNATRDDLRRLAMWLSVEEPQLRKVIDVAIDTVERVREAEFWHAAKAGEHSVETPFMVADGAQLLAGIIDLIHKENNGWMITDYKTDVDNTPERSTAYAMQLDRYKGALEACGLAVAGTNLAPVRRP